MKATVDLLYRRVIDEYILINESPTEEHELLSNGDIQFYHKYLFGLKRFPTKRITLDQIVRDLSKREEFNDLYNLKNQVDVKTAIVFLYFIWKLRIKTTIPYKWKPPYKYSDEESKQNFTILDVLSFPARQGQSELIEPEEVSAPQLSAVTLEPY